MIALLVSPYSARFSPSRLLRGGHAVHGKEGNDEIPYPTGTRVDYLQLLFQEKRKRTETRPHGTVESNIRRLFRGGVDIVVSIRNFGR